MEKIIINIYRLLLIINEVKFTLYVFMRVFASGKKYVCLLLVLKSDALSAFTVCFFYDWRKVVDVGEN